MRRRVSHSPFASLLPQVDQGAAASASLASKAAVHPNKTSENASPSQREKSASRHLQFYPLVPVLCVLPKDASDPASSPPARASAACSGHSPSVSRPHISLSTCRLSRTPSCSLQLTMALWRGEQEITQENVAGGSAAS